MGNLKFARNGLKIFSYIAIALGILYVVLAVLTIAGSPVITDALNTTNVEGMDIKTLAIIAIIAFVLGALFSFFYAYLMQLACKNGKKTTLLLVLAIVNTVFVLKAVISAFSVINLLRLLLNGFILYLVIIIRKFAK